MIMLEIRPGAWHWHEDLEVLVVTEGTVLAAAGGEKCVLPVGDGIFINAGVLHADWQASAVPCRLRSMVFHPRLVGGSADSVFWQKYLQPLLTDPTRPCAVLHREIPWQRAGAGGDGAGLPRVVNEVPGYEFKARAACQR